MFCLFIYLFKSEFNRLNWTLLFDFSLSFLFIFALSYISRLNLMFAFLNKFNFVAADVAMKSTIIMLTKLIILTILIRQMLLMMILLMAILMTIRWLLLMMMS